MVRPGRDLEEVGNALRMIGLCTTDAEVRQAVKQIDVGGDGNIQWDEFLHFMAKQMAEPKLMNNEFDMAFDGETRAARGSQSRAWPTAPSTPAHRDPRVCVCVAVLVNMCAVERVELLRRLKLISPNVNVTETLSKPGEEAPAVADDEHSAQLQAGSKWHSVRAEIASGRLRRPPSPPLGPETSTSDRSAGDRSAGSSTTSKWSRRSSGPSRSSRKQEQHKEKVRQSLFRMGSRPLEVDYPDIDTAMLRLVLADAGTPFNPMEMERFLRLVDPLRTGRVASSDLRALPCWLTEEDERRREKSKKLQTAAGVSPGNSAGNSRDTSPQQLAPAASSQLAPAPAATPPPGMQFVTYATVPEGVSPGDVLAVESVHGSVLRAIVPEGCTAGSVFGIVEGKVDVSSSFASLAKVARSSFNSSPLAPAATPSAAPPSIRSTSPPAAASSGPPLTAGPPAAVQAAVKSAVAAALTAAAAATPPAASPAATEGIQLASPGSRGAPSAAKAAAEPQEDAPRRQSLSQRTASAAKWLVGYGQPAAAADDRGDEEQPGGGEAEKPPRRSGGVGDTYSDEI